MSQSLPDPQTTLQRRHLLDRFATMIRRGERLEQIHELIAEAAQGDQVTSPDVMEQLPGVSRSLSRLVSRMVPGTDCDPVITTAPLLRLAARVAGLGVDAERSLSTGRIALAGLIGVDDEEAEEPHRRFRAALASLALLEIAQSRCWPSKPDCGACPLQDTCDFSRRNALQLNMREVKLEPGLASAGNPPG